ncbi:MAG: YgaP family membrane protein [Thermoanaerobaculaceae bacterium]
MQANVGGVDRVIRTLAGIVILGLGLGFKSFWGLLGLLPLATGIFLSSLYAL